MEMKKFTYYAWRDDDEGGCSLCLTKDYKKHYNPLTGPHARPSEIIATFDTAEEFAQILKDDEWGKIKSDEEYLADAEKYIQSVLNRQHT